MPVVAVILAGLAAIPGCSTPATTWHTLMRPAASPSAGVTLPGPSAAPDPNPSSMAMPPIDVLDIGVPAQVDVPQLVVTHGDGSMQRLEQQRWAAPLNVEFRDALSASLTRRLGAADLHGTGRTTRPAWRVATTVRRFDAQTAGPSALQVSWTLRRLPRKPQPAPDERAAGKDARNVAAPSFTVSCETLLTFGATTGPAAIVEGFRRAIDGLADRIAMTLRQAEAGAMRLSTTADDDREAAVPCPADRAAIDAVPGLESSAPRNRP